MLIAARRSMSRGFTLIELLVVISLIGILLVIGVPAFGTWTADSKVRAASEAMLSALRTTQGSAVARSRVGVFALTNATPSATATAIGNGSNWIGFLLPLANTDDTTATMGTLVSAMANSQYGVTISGPAVTCFNALGQTAAETATVTGMGAACTLSSGVVAYTISAPRAKRQYSVQVYSAGRVRMCDALKTLSTNNPDGC